MSAHGTHATSRDEVLGPFSGAIRTSIRHRRMTEVDPNRTWRCYSIAPRGGPITQTDAQYPPHPAPMNAASLQGDVGKRVMKTVLLGAVVAITATLAHPEDMAEMISRYRHAHGLSTVKTDPQLTAIPEPPAKAIAPSRLLHPPPA